jgi:calcium-dependent protein kinase
MGCSQPSKTSDDNTNKPPKRISKTKNADIRKNYEFISMLGNGNFGKVRLYRDRKQKDLLFAIKTLKKETLTRSYFELIKNEVNILSNLDHPNIVKYFGVYEDDYYIHILMEYLKGYDLYKIIALKKYTGFDEKDICEIIYQLLQALSFIHNQNIIHRDIKPENILFASKKDYSTLKLIKENYNLKKWDAVKKLLCQKKAIIIILNVYQIQKILISEKIMSLYQC